MKFLDDLMRKYPYPQGINRNGRKITVLDENWDEIQRAVEMGYSLYRIWGQMKENGLFTGSYIWFCKLYKRKISVASTDQDSVMPEKKMTSPQQSAHAQNTSGVQTHRDHPADHAKTASGIRRPADPERNTSVQQTVAQTTEQETRPPVPSAAQTRVQPSSAGPAVQRQAGSQSAPAAQSAPSSSGQAAQKPGTEAPARPAPQPGASSPGQTANVPALGTPGRPSAEQGRSPFTPIRKSPDAPPLYIGREPPKPHKLVTSMTPEEMREKLGIHKKPE